MRSKTQSNRHTHTQGLQILCTVHVREQMMFELEKKVERVRVCANLLTYMNTKLL